MVQIVMVPMLQLFLLKRIKQIAKKLMFQHILFSFISLSLPVENYIRDTIGIWAF